MTPPTRHSVLEVLWVAARLGMTSFGGPVAHLGYFHEEYVKRRNWLDEQRYADLVALCQFLPGPASSQVGIAVGILRAGLPGAIAAWVGFTLPSALILVAFALGVEAFGDTGRSGWLGGLKIVAVAVVAQAVWQMARSLCPDRSRATLAAAATLLTLAWPSALGQVLSILGAGVIGIALFPATESPVSSHAPVGIGKRSALAAWFAFAFLLFGLPLVRQLTGSHTLNVFDSFFRVGSLVFGGGHVVLPLLKAEVVGPGWVTEQQFVAGYGAAQGVPGPLFTFSAYLGTVLATPPNGWAGAVLALFGIFLPSFLLIIGTLPFWDFLRTRPTFKAALTGINAAVVGLLIAALYKPVWTSSILSTADFCLALVAFNALMFWKVPPWVVVVATALGGEILSRWA